MNGKYQKPFIALWLVAFAAFGSARAREQEQQASGDNDKGSKHKDSRVRRSNRPDAGEITQEVLDHV